MITAAGVVAYAGAIDDEIALWEERARNNTDARTILRAFLGLRELLWEFGVRSPETPSEPDAATRPTPRKSARRRRTPRVQRVSIER